MYDIVYQIVEIIAVLGHAQAVSVCEEFVNEYASNTLAVYWLSNKCNLFIVSLRFCVGGLRFSLLNFRSLSHDTERYG